MKIGSKMTLWGCFVLSVFLIMSICGFLTGTITMWAARNGIIAFRRPNHLFFVASQLLTGVIIGTVISVIIGRWMMKPMAKLNNAIKEIAAGNFKLQLDENRGLREVRELSHSFNLMASELSGIETFRNDFISNVSHEFKTPLSAIEGYATLLQDECLSTTERKEYANLIIEASKRLSNLTGNILILSKLDNQNIVASPTNFSLDEQIRNVILLYERDWSEKNIDLAIDLEEIKIDTNEELTWHIWHNLLSNAIKFTPPFGSISITLRKVNNEACFSISDTGIGIEQEEQERIFQKFYQVDSARGTEGNGLGLSLVQKIVSLCKGNLEIKSALGEGSCFAVNLPLNLNNAEK